MPKGTVVVSRDFVILTALATARYLTTDQIMRLAFTGRDESIVRRRLRRLEITGPKKLDPLIRSMSYRKLNGAPLKVWALTEAGYVLAKKFVPNAALSGKDVGTEFLEHSILLNEVLVNLVLLVRHNVNPFADLPFRWIPETSACINFEHYDRSKVAMEKVRIKPDATLEVGKARLRLFLEFETGAHTIVSTDPANTSATWAKIQRYGLLVAGSIGQHDATTPYSLFFSDRFIPVLVFLTQSPRRRDAIRKLVDKHFGAAKIKVRAFTSEEAPGIFASLVRGRNESAEPVDVHADESECRSTTSLTTPQLELLFLALRQSRGVIEEQIKRLARSNGANPNGQTQVTRIPESLSNAIDLLQRFRNGGAIPGKRVQTPRKTEEGLQSSAPVRQKALTADG